MSTVISLSRGWSTNNLYATFDLGGERPEPGCSPTRSVLDRPENAAVTAALLRAQIRDARQRLASEQEPVSRWPGRSLGYGRDPGDVHRRARRGAAEGGGR